MNKLEKARLEINRADKVIAQRFEQRMNAVKDVIAYKKENNLPIFDGGREKEILAKNTEFISDRELKNYYKDLLTQLIRVSKEYQNAILHRGVYGYQGAKGAFGHIATSRLFPGGQQKNYGKFEDVVKAVLNHEIEKGVLPFENSTTGEIGEVLDLLYKYDVCVSAFYNLKVEQNLLGVKGAQLSDIKRVYSKQQAIDQCEAVLSAFDFEMVPYANTALAARLVSESGDKSLAAIAAKESAREYGLDILMENINTDSDNVTRFIVIENTLPAHSDRVMVMFTVNHESGSLAKILQIIAAYNVNMTNIRSRACKDKSWQYYFYVEAEGDLADHNLRACFDECARHCRQLRIIGGITDSRAEN